MLAVRMAGCVFAVSFSSASLPVKQMAESFSPRASSASSNTRRATGKASASSLHMPGYWEPWPGKMNAVLLMRLSLKDVLNNKLPAQQGRTVGETAAEGVQQCDIPLFQAARPVCLVQCDRDRGR